MSPNLTPAQKSEVQTLLEWHLKTMHQLEESDAPKSLVEFHDTEATLLWRLTQ